MLLNNGTHKGMVLKSYVTVSLRKFNTFQRLPFFSETMNVLQKLLKFDKPLMRSQLRFIEEILRTRKIIFYVVSLISLHDVLL